MRRLSLKSTLFGVDPKKVFLPRKIKSGIAGSARQSTPAGLYMPKGRFCPCLPEPILCLQNPIVGVSAVLLKNKKGAEKIPHLKIGGPGGD